MRLFVPIFFLFFAQFVTGQNNLITSKSNYIADVQFFGTEQGLSHRQVYCTYEDSDGFIWLGTKYGLNRFDGYDFKWFTKEKNGLSSNEIHQILQDNEGWLWLISTAQNLEKTEIKQLCFFHPHTGAIQTLQSRFGEDLSVSEQEIFHIHKDERTKTIFIGTEDGRVLIQKPGEKFRTLSNPEWNRMFPRLQLWPESVLAESSVSNVSATLYYVTFEGKIKNTREGFRFQDLGIDSDGNILGYYKPYLKAENRLIDFVSINPADLSSNLKNNFVSIPIEYDDWFCMIYQKEKDQTFWYKSETRFFVFLAEGGIIYDFNRTYPEISKSVIHDIYFDQKGRAWVSGSHGFYIIRLKENPFKQFFQNSSKEYDVNEFLSCRGIVEQNGFLWTGTEFQGNFKLDLKTGNYNILSEFEITNIRGQHTKSEGRTIIKGKEGHLLFADTELINYRISDESYQTALWDDGKNHSIWSLYEDQNGIFWVGSYDGELGRWKPGNDRIRIFEDWNEFNLPRGGYIYTYVEPDKNHLLIGTSFGLYILNRQKGILKRYWTGGKGDAYFPNDNIFHLTKDKDSQNVIWAATGGGGLVQIFMNRDSSAFISNHTQYTVADGLTNNTLYAVYEDEAGSLWLPSDYGIIKFDKNSKGTRAYLQKDGITHNEFNRISHYKDSMGNLYFGGLNGITAFHPRALVGEKESPNIPLRITEFSQFDSESKKITDKTSQILTNRQITLRPGERFFNLQFALLEYSKSDRIRYAYKIEGQDAEWNFISDNSLRISGLDYGEYLLHIRGKGGDGQFSKQELSIPIYVLKPFYIQNWFLVTAVFGVLALIFSLYKYRTNQLKRQKALLEKLVRERTETIEKQNQKLQKLVAFSIGVKDVVHFSRQFKARFGKFPSEYF